MLNLSRAKLRGEAIMRLAISNIAWDIAEDEDVARLLLARGVDAIDIAPGKYFPNLFAASSADIDRVKTWWADRNISITGMQSLLFGTTGLNVFADETIQKKMIDHLTAICRIAGRLNSPRLVFGSPKNRDRSGLSDEKTHEMAVSFFRRLGDRAQQEGVWICLEPNPTVYGANFMMDSKETAGVVRAVNHPAIRMQFDTGALTINGEDPETVLADASALIGHIHASEPGLVTLGAETDHAKMAGALFRHLPEAIVSIEMVASKEEPHLQAIAHALDVAEVYRKQP